RLDGHRVSIFKFRGPLLKPQGYHSSVQITHRHCRKTRAWSYFNDLRFSRDHRADPSSKVRAVASDLRRGSPPARRVPKALPGAPRRAPEAPSAPEDAPVSPRVSELLAGLDAAVPGRLLVAGALPPGGRDIDLIVRREDRPALAQCLLGLGFRARDHRWVRFDDEEIVVVEVLAAEALGLPARELE